MMKPGRELDRLVAEILGWKEWEFSNPGRDGQEAFRYKTLVPPEYDGSNLQHLSMIIPHYSTHIEPAMIAFEWLTEHNPWRPDEVAIMTMNGDPSVCLVNGRAILLASGESYSHAISLAVVEAGKVKQ